MKVHVNYFVSSPRRPDFPLGPPSMQWTQWGWGGWGLKLTSHLPLIPELYSCRPTAVPHRHRYNYTCSTQQDRCLPNSRIKLVNLLGEVWRRRWILNRSYLEFVWVVPVLLPSGDETEGPFTRTKESGRHGTAVRCSWTCTWQDCKE